MPALFIEQMGSITQSSESKVIPRGNTLSMCLSKVDLKEVESL